MAIPAGLSAGIRSGIKVGVQTANATKSFDSATPRLEERAEVTCYGNPDSSMSELYFLAMSVAFGLIKRRDVNRLTVPSGVIKIDYATHIKAVSFTVSVVTSYKSFATTLGSPGMGIQLFQGPPETIVGGEFQWNSAIPNLPGGPGFRMEKLGWENRVILTPHGHYNDKEDVRRPSENPVPPFDDTSRGTAAQAAEVAREGDDRDNWHVNPNWLLYAALEAPCSTTGKVMQAPVPGGVVKIDPAALSTDNQYPKGPQ